MKLTPLGKFVVYSAWIVFSIALGILSAYWVVVPAQ